MIRSLSMAFIFGSASMAGAQVIYEPVVVQYGGQNPYYYAGNDLYVHAAARFPHVEGATFGRVPGYAFVSPRRQVVERNYRVFTDSFGTVDARPWGLTPNQVVNEANARLPKYFAKRDLLATAKAEVTSTRVVFTVPADAGVMDRVQPRGTMSIRPSVPTMYQGRGRGPLFSIPRSMMDRKVNDIVKTPSPQA